MVATTQPVYRNEMLSQVLRLEGTLGHSEATQSAIWATALPLQSTNEMKSNGIEVCGMAHKFNSRFGDRGKFCRKRCVVGGGIVVAMIFQSNHM